MWAPPSCWRGKAECHGRAVSGDTLVFEEIAGLVRMQLMRQGAAVAGASLAAPQALAVGDAVPAEVVAQACAIGVDDIETRRHQPCIASCGAPFILAELKERRALAAAQPRADVFARHLPRDGATGIHLYVHTAGADRGEGADIQCRMFAPLHGIPEDPATGSANVALIGLLAKLRPEPDLRLAKKIAQGVDMGRPSLLEARAEKTAGVVTDSYIGGACVPVMRGTLDLA